MTGEFESLKGSSADKNARDPGQQIVDKAEARENLTWGDTYILERSVFLMLPNSEVHQRLWCVEARYRDAVGDATAYETYLKVEAPKLTPESDEHARARLDNFIRELYRLYTVIDCRQTCGLSSLKRALLLTLWLQVPSIVLVLLGKAFSQYAWLIPFSVVFAAGSIGGAVSFIRRLQSLPNRGESLGDFVELTGGAGQYFSLIAGGVFAIVLCILFAAGLVSGGVFPVLEPARLPGMPSAACARILDFAYVIHSYTFEDWGKLVIWSFIAGFAERFVPDTLDHLIARSDEKKQS